jgi:hypothetical protein
VGLSYRLAGVGLAVVVTAAACSSSHRSPATQQNVQSPAVLGDLYFRPVLCTLPPPDRHISLTVPPGSACQSSTPGLIASSSDASETAGSSVILPFINGGVRYVLGPADLTSTDVDSTKVQEAPGGGWQVSLKLTTVGTRKLDAVAATRYPYFKRDPSNPPPQSREAIEQGHTVFSAPPMEATDFNGYVVINTPGMRLGLANELASLINEMVAYHRVHGTQT